MELKQLERDGIQILEISGDIDLFRSREIRDTISALVDQGKNQIVIDLGGVQYIDSSGLGVLISGRQQLLKAQGDLKIARITESVQRVVTITKLNALLEFYDDLDEALYSFS
jgi:anti-sigma B factor antagonist